MTWKKGRRFVRQAPEPRAIEMEPEELAVYARSAEKVVLPIIKERHSGPGAAQFLLAQQTRVLVTGDGHLTTESRMAIANSVLAHWQGDTLCQNRRTPNHQQREQEGRDRCTD